MSLKKTATEIIKEIIEEIIEEVKVEMCDKYCRYSIQLNYKEELYDICEHCPLNKL